MRSLLPLTVCCISLVSLQRLLALELEERPDERRLDFLSKLMDQRESGSQADTALPSTPLSQSPKWLTGFLGHSAASRVRTASPSLDWARPSEDPQEKRSRMRVRRLAHSGSRGGHHPAHHAQLMRVGCVLGTCQVQNLSHRLYQLIGQSGREDSSPINPRSPHSYG